MPSWIRGIVSTFAAKLYGEIQATHQDFDKKHDTLDGKHTASSDQLRQEISALDTIDTSALPSHKELNNYLIIIFNRLNP